MMSIETMAELKCVIFWGFFTLFWTLSRGDLEVSCQFSRTCILPCSFPPGDQVVIHWIRHLPIKSQVHSYYHNQDQMGQQSDEFKGRTSLSNQLISTGNASLQLSNVMVQDEGRYQCYTSTINGNKETFIQLKVYEVSIETLTQPASEALQPGQRLTIRCQVSYSFDDYYGAWIRHPAGKGVEWIGMKSNWFTFYKDSLKNKFSIDIDASSSTVTLNGENMQPEDSAVYYCARYNANHSDTTSSRAVQKPLGV
ncbi:PREDICTED: CD276 antigen-like [Cyprinodon variegatus]|uniref:CD276 antigen-like n=1 Tax=Cyprinodon variegatus TaxID=28743 RepID=UPI00074283B6|nr:PREDICTED: CD276 antigen-like [Cyprinodon variegatus]